jgi:chromodomain-helicase-DNA-binding protein 7
MEPRERLRCTDETALSTHVFYMSCREAREVIQEHEFWFNEPYVTRAQATSFRKQGILKFDLLLTTYEVVIKDSRMLCKIPWKVLIVDEAHRLKNTNSRLVEQLSTLPSEHCVLLTGTPLQNKTEELWSLLHFSDKHKFRDQQDFLNRFGNLKDADQVAQLHDMLKPYLLRRVKEDVEKSLPPKEETIVEVSLTPMQKQFYRAIYEKNTAFLFKGAKPANAPSLMNVMMELRKCCNHPYLIRGVEERIISEMSEHQRTDASVHEQMVQVRA